MAVPEVQSQSVSEPLYKHPPKALTCSKRHAANNNILSKQKHEQHLFKPSIDRRVNYMWLEKKKSTMYLLPNMPNIRQDPRCLINLKKKRHSNIDCKIGQQMSTEYNSEKNAPKLRRMEEI